MSTIAINGLGFSATVEVQPGESYAVALERAGLDTEAVDVSVAGQPVDLETQVPADGAAVTTSPKNAALGA